MGTFDGDVHSQFILSFITRHDTAFGKVRVSKFCVGCTPISFSKVLTQSHHLSNITGGATAIMSAMYRSMDSKTDPWLEQKEGDKLDFPLLFDAPMLERYILLCAQGT